jgi:iron(III) transport system substrate-binding protein
MKKPVSLLMVLLLMVGVAAVTGCGRRGADPAPGNNDNEPVETGKIIIYSSRNENFVNTLLEKFEADTGIKVEVLHAGDAAVNKIKEESRNVQADIFISNDVGALENLRLNDLLQGFVPAGIETIDARYRAEDNSWFALSARTRVLMYNKNLISEEEMPKTVWELTDPKWQGKFAITRGGNGSMIAHVSALRQEWGDDKTSEWLSLVKDNAGAITQGHGDIRRAVGSGEFAFGLVNNYYFHQQLREPADNQVGVIYPDQGAGEMGAVVNGAGVAFIKGAPNTFSAQRFLEWVLLPENQREFSYASLEVPINPAIEAVPEAAAISDYKVHSMPLRKLGEVWEDTRELIEKSGLDLEIR